MTLYLLDTDTFSEYLNEDTLPDSEAPVTRRMAALAPDQAVICVVTGVIYEDWTRTGNESE